MVCLAGGEGFGNTRRKLNRIDERTLRDDRCSNTSGVAFLAVSPEYRRKLLFIGLIDDVGRCAIRIRAHPHVERTASVKREPSLVGFKLVGRDAKVTEDALNAVGESISSEDASDVCIVGSDDPETGTVGCALDSIRITVDADNAK